MRDPANRENEKDEMFSLQIPRRWKNLSLATLLILSTF